MNEFIHPVDVPVICDRLGVTLKELAMRLGMKSEKSLYKWRVPKRLGEKSSGSARPDFEAILILLDMGVTCEELFGSKACPKVQQQAHVDSPLTRSEISQMISQAIQYDRLDRSKAG